jgi:putative SOS response-associated peptidase YedK
MVGSIRSLAARLRLRWGLIPHWCKDPKGGCKPINAKAETVARLPMFRDAYARRRCILAVDGFFEWKAIKGLKAKQPFAIAMRDGSPFGIAGIWENWKDSASGEWQGTFAIITVPPNELLAQIHDGMPAIPGRADYGRWLSDESDAHDLMRPFPAEPMRMWLISTRVKKPDHFCRVRPTEFRKWCFVLQSSTRAIRVAQLETTEAESCGRFGSQNSDRQRSLSSGKRPTPNRSPANCAFGSKRAASTSRTSWVA